MYIDFLIFTANGFYFEAFERGRRLETVIRSLNYFGSLATSLPIRYFVTIHWLL